MTFAGSNPPELAVNLFEHNWISPITACPSNRIPWNAILAQLEDDMAQDEVADWLGDGTERTLIQATKRLNDFNVQTRQLLNDADAARKAEIEVLTDRLDALQTGGAHGH